MSTPIRNSFTVHADIGEAWATLTDIKRIAHCVPGAELTEVVDDRTYKGKIGVRLGPISLAFAGQVRFEALDAAAYRATLKASGTDAKGRGGAQATVLCGLTAVESGTRVDIETTLTLSGMIAQYGRASGMIAGVAQQLIDQFAKALEADMAMAVKPQAAAPPPVQQIPGLRLLWRGLIATIVGWFRRRRT